MTIQRSIKKALQNPESVSGLDLRQAKPQILFPEIEKFINLEYIDLSNCVSLNWADACIKLSKLPKLKEMKAFAANIQSLPTEIGLLTSLKKIDLSNNPGLKAIPEIFSSLIALEEITFYGCGLEGLPGTPWHFGNLESLTISRNKITSIPSQFFEGMPKLNALFVADNQLSELPLSISSLSALRTFYLGNNPLTALPETITSLTNLDTFWIDSCPAIDFESALQYLRNSLLRNLNILGNNISTLPLVIKEFQALEVLNINSNKFDNIEQLIRDLATLRLKKLDLRFMGFQNISLEQARVFIPTLQEIACDTRTTELLNSEISTWIKSEIAL